MPTTKPIITLEIGELSDQAAKMILAICAKTGCTPNEALKIVANRIGKEVSS